MIINTKFNIKDTVWVMENNYPAKCIVVKIRVNVVWNIHSLQQDLEVLYTVEKVSRPGDSSMLLEHYLFSSLEALLADLATKEQS